MAGTSLIALIDDIASLLDDVSVLTKVAAKKTAGVLGDDLALNAQQVSGVAAHRELPVVWAVAKGSMINKAILVPAALALSAFAPVLVRPLLMLGGAFLCFEGFEKLAHKLFHRRDEEPHDAGARLAEVAAPDVDLVALEKDKIKGAIRTDFVLSAEIVAISLGAVAEAPFVTRAGVLVGISAVMTVGVYGLVAGIVKLDDLGLHLVGNPAAGGPAPSRLRRTLGLGILATAPRLMRFLSVAGTAAMFLVGGGILTHGVPPVEQAIEGVAAAARSVSVLGGLLAVVAAPVLNGLVGVVAGGVALGLVTAVKAVVRRVRGQRG